MKRFLLLLFLVFAGSIGYLVYNGELKETAWKIKRFLFSNEPSHTAQSPGDGKAAAPAPRPQLFQRTHQLAVSKITDPQATLQEKVGCWKQLSDIYLHRKSSPQDRDLVLAPLKNFVDAHLLSSDIYVHEALADRVSVVWGDSLYSIAKKYGTTVEAIKYINEMRTDNIFSGMSLKVLNNRIGLFVDKSEFRLWATYGGYFFFEMVCGIGKNKKTPAGTFVIKNRMKNPEWTRRGMPTIPAGDPRNQLGAYWLGFKDTPTATGLGIHEAVNGVGLGEAKSNGCIRLARSDVELIYTLVPVGTLVIIRE